MKRIFVGAACGVAAISLSGCSANFLDRVFGPVDAHPTVYGAQPMSHSDESHQLDLPSLIDPDMPAHDGDDCKSGTESADAPSSRSGGWIFGDSDQYKVRVCYEDRYKNAIKNFYLKLDSTKQQAARTRIQEVLLAKSTALCNSYKKQVLQTAVEQNISFGDASTLLAGLASIFSKTQTVRPLAASSAVISGFRSEFNQDVFANLTIQVITAGIDKRRSDWYGQVVKSRSCTIDQYPLEQAIKDAFYYHASCSLITGVEEAITSIHQAQSPGLDTLTDTMKKIAGLNSALKVATQPLDPASSQATQLTTSLTVTQSLGSKCEIPIPSLTKTTVEVAATQANFSTVTVQGTARPGEVVTLNAKGFTSPVTITAQKDKLSAAEIAAQLKEAVNAAKGLPKEVYAQPAGASDTGYTQFNMFAVDSLTASEHASESLTPTQSDGLKVVIFTVGGTVSPGDQIGVTLKITDPARPQQQIPVQVLVPSDAQSLRDVAQALKDALLKNNDLKAYYPSLAISDPTLASDNTSYIVTLPKAPPPKGQKSLTWVETDWQSKLTITIR